MFRYPICPACKSAFLEPIRKKNIEVDACPRCAGLWFDNNELTEVVRESIGSVPDQAMVEQGKAYSDRPCPRCEIPLIVHPFRNQEDPFDVDICHRCYGIWLDKGELERVQKSQAKAIIERDRTLKDWLFQFFLQLPVEFNLKPKRFPIITIALLVINIPLLLMFFVGVDIRSVFDDFALHPIRFGAMQWYLSLFTHMFLHGGLFHLIMNMYFLYVLGDNVEDALGHFGYLIFYLFAGIAGGLTHTFLAWGDTTPMIGASGAISGIIAAYAVFFRHAKLTFMVIFFQFKLSAPFYVAIWLAMNIVGFFANQRGVAWGAHLGGFIAGLVLAFLLDGWVLKHRPMIRLMRKN